MWTHVNLDSAVELVAGDWTLHIQDYDTQGIISVLSQAKKGDVKEVTVRVVIEHSYIGDLQVELVAPSGRFVLRKKLKVCSRTLVLISTASVINPVCH